MTQTWSYDFFQNYWSFQNHFSFQIFLKVLFGTVFYKIKISGNFELAKRYIFSLFNQPENNLFDGQIKSYKS